MSGPPARPKKRRPKPGEPPVVPAGLPSAQHSDIGTIVTTVFGTGAAAPAPTQVQYSTVPAGDGEVGFAPLDWFAHRPDNPRWEWEYDPEHDEETAGFRATFDSYGLVQAVTVTGVGAWLEHHPEHNEKLPDTVQLVVTMGNRRLEMARHAGLPGLPYYRNDKLATRTAGREAPIIENYHRSGFDPVREAAEFVQILHDTKESVRELAGRLGISHTQINQRLKLLQLIPEFQNMVSDRTLAVYRALPIADLEHPDQRKLLDLGPPYQPVRLTAPEPDTRRGKTLSAPRAVTIRKHSTPSDVVTTLRKRLPPEFLAQVVDLLREEAAAQ